MRSLGSYKIKQRRALCQQDKWMNLFKLIILLVICMCRSGGEIQIGARAFSAVALTAGAGWLWCCLHFPEKENALFFFFSWCLPNPDLPCDKPESSLAPRENWNWNGVERTLGARVAPRVALAQWNPWNAPVWLRLELLPFPLRYLSSVQRQRLIGWSCKISGVAFALWGL